ncbi:MAG: TIGR04282 family arsenosugar biosynthesis glycosyltransferase [Cyanobacteriota bacterium]|nr:TIGR04282 family arsenosugar biosynthesis glycosyltransferase [Cyanobacteriota bacterium]
MVSARRHLLLFTRFPEPGQSKTRLIPALGAEGAARLQRRLTEQTLAQAERLLTLCPVDLQIYFTGADLQSMVNWLGPQRNYVPQGDGDLGARLERACRHSFQNGAAQVILIGADCPGLTAELLREAFKALDSYPFVLGPALDGGYYLLGLTKLYRALFTDIPWGSAEVFSQTVAKLRMINVPIAFLAALQDVDRPEDLELVKGSQIDAIIENGMTTACEIKSSMDKAGMYIWAGLSQS